MALADLFKAVQEACTPAVWSQGVLMTRGDGTFIRHGNSPDEMVLRVVLKNKPVSPKVTLSLDDVEWHCDCGDREDPCAHVAAAVIAAKKGDVQMAPERGAAPGGTRSAPTAGGLRVTPGAPVATSKFVEYRFGRDPAGLSFARYIICGAEETLVEGSLLSAVGAGQSGRAPGPRLSATQSDFSANAALRTRTRATGPIDRETLFKLLVSLDGCPTVTLDGQPVSVSGRPAGMRTRLVDDGHGFRLQRYRAVEGVEDLGHGVVLDRGVLRPLDAQLLSNKEDQWLAGDGQYFSPADAAKLVTAVLPDLQKKIKIDIQTTRLPRVIETPPRVLLQLDKDNPETLSVVGKLVYGDPLIMQLNPDNLQLVPVERDLGHRIPDVIQRDSNAERQAMQRLRSELNLQVGRRVQFKGVEAVRWVKQLKGWDMAGDGYAAFKPQRAVVPRFDVRDQSFDVHFEVPGEGDAYDAVVGRVDPQRMFRAWREGAEFVPLLDGGWAPLPADWMKRYGKRLGDLLAAKAAQPDQKLPAYLVPEFTDLCDELGQEYPDALAELKKGFANFETIPDAELPAELRADLRLYQRRGVNWLSFLRDVGLGALLADDMGLGKTLQALCSIRGRTLVVAPTSVLYNWDAEIKKFRPNLKSSVYYGAQRTLDASADVVLTTYALLRLDLEKLAAEEWDTLVLDEAQTIKNPDSQVAKSAHRLRGKFRIALSGTPIENRLDDLWSQFQFLNPGFLGSREEFRDQYIAPIGRGDTDVAARLRARTKPFILRRLKRSVAPELPPRTETVLRCELSSTERDLYDSLLLATKKEVLEQLEAGGSIMAALETLLRLRQACCHPSLIPGQTLDASGSSSKIDLLMETLGDSLEQGHRSLIFSQWTSYLDVIERALNERGIRSSRIDGSTQNRQDLVNEFQRDDGPSVMLISLKAGGTGLTLTAADHIFIMDPWWNPAVEDQAADRAHRIGQKNPVLIHRLVAQETVEEKILELQKKKSELAAAVLDGTGAAVSLTRQDLINLLT